MDRQFDVEFRLIVASIAGDAELVDREARLCIVGVDVLELFPGGDELFVVHAEHGLRPALGVEQQVGVGTDVFDFAFDFRRFGRRGGLTRRRAPDTG